MSRKEIGSTSRIKKIASLMLSASMLTLPTGGFAADRDSDPATATPIKHLVVIFQENVSFDHYFATYPHAAALPGSDPFRAREGTPSVNGLTAGLIANNPNSTQPFLLTPADNYTCDQDHNYADEQKAFDSGLMDLFPEKVGTASCSKTSAGVSGRGVVMGYYDGNTVAAMWNYAQHFAMSDNSYGTTFGPSTPGALNLTSGNTAPVDPANTTNVSAVNGVSVVSDADPTYDDCSAGTTIAMQGQNVGNLLNTAGITWGWFQGGFRPTATTAGKAVCGATSTNGAGSTADYSAHHEPFQYYLSTSNPHHLPPTSTAVIGTNSDQANHQYDLVDFWAAVDAGRMPAVSFLKAKKIQDGHAGYSSPLDEQTFLVQTINRLENTREWNETAVIIAYDDSDGWYDHQIGPIVNHSNGTSDFLTGVGSCGDSVKNPPLGGFESRCGYGPRLPLVVVSPWAKRNFVDSTTTDQSSVLRFIEDNYLSGQRIGSGSFDAIAGSLSHMFDFDHGPHAGKLFLDSTTGQVTGGDRD